ncbi:carbohydrate ABC transporter substrate-binding protein, CUT1 family [Arboricoccus pini]|uniref:Carbohydrate ABC transporter substrate-binding protein, CUT1 family n=1 Tax=Arboricoccus pini TaxID=1963835 RepID=A0A212RN37_9PROT|nr:sugar ABC transporter substrate-binding protein [Arboricoccus pini]SNB73931.1 carbohydrate ABC transporter substrate-binding protein, CUT1 family [Arboricoccus pini]
MRRSKLLRAMPMAAMLLLTAAGGVLPAAAIAADAQPYAGQTITVILPPWGTLPKALLDDFTAKTGVNVDLQTLGWDDIRTKIVTSMVAGTAPADVTDVDWSWVGQFAAANWYLPLNDVVAKDVLSDLPAAPNFTVDGKLVAVPYNNDFRILIVNGAHLKAAGITSLPKTPDELLTAARAIKAKGIATYPLALPLSASEGTSTAWYLLTKAFGGDLFNKDMQPAFTDPQSGGYKALAFELQALKEGLIDPAMTGMTDVQLQQLFADGKVSIDLAGWAGNPSVYADKSKSKVADAVATGLVPNVSGKSRSYALPEGLGIPISAPHKEAARLFVAWWTQPDTQQAVYAALGDLPTLTSALQALNKEGKLVGGDTLLAQTPFLEPLFPAGAPAWYAEFSSAVSTTINQAAKGQLGLEEAIAAIAKGAREAMEP